MIGEITQKSDLKIYTEASMPDGGRIIIANPAYGWIDRNVNESNRNVFRIDPFGNIVWQVRRDEKGFINWDARNRNTTITNPTFTDGYRDPFVSMGTQFFSRHLTNDNRPYYPKFSYELFDVYAPGRLLGLNTFEFEYDLDPETGIATCTGIPVK